MLDDLVLFFGATHAAQSKVYARLPRPSQPGQWTLAGALRGPHCAIAETLPTTEVFRDLGPGADLLAAATVIDPCFWSPRLPAYYQARIELRCDGKAVAAIDRQLGIRMLGASGKSLYLEGRRWVVRAVDGQSATSPSLADWRDAPAAALIDEPDDPLCAEASEAGVLLIARLTSDEAGLSHTLRRLSRWPAVAMAAIVDPPQDGASLRTVAPNLLLGAWTGPNASPIEPAWADVAFVEVGNNPSTFSDRTIESTLPIVAVRRLASPASLAAARRACDLLQRDLAPQVDCAGYCV